MSKGQDKMIQVDEVVVEMEVGLVVFIMADKVKVKVMKDDETVPW